MSASTNIVWDSIVQSAYWPVREQPRSWKIEKSNFCNRTLSMICQVLDITDSDGRPCRINLGPTSGVTMDTAAPFPRSVAELFLEHSQSGESAALVHYRVSQSLTSLQDCILSNSGGRVQCQLENIGTWVKENFEHGPTRMRHFP